jgi:hypothetical protein
MSVAFVSFVFFVVGVVRVERVDGVLTAVIRWGSQARLSLPLHQH